VHLKRIPLEDVPPGEGQGYRVRVRARFRAGVRARVRARVRVRVEVRASGRVRTSDPALPEVRLYTGRPQV
jgi:hypothetical protein